MGVKRKTKRNKRLIGMLAIAIFILVSTFASIDMGRSTPHTNLIDTKISQYSNRNITPNAIITNKKFKDIAFESTVPKNYPLKNHMATVVRSFKHWTFFLSKKEKLIEEKGTWLWTPTMQMTEEYMDSIIQGAKENNINTIYLSIDSYLDIFSMPEGNEKNKQKELFSEKLTYFIAEANKMGIEVDAEAGWKNWAENEHTYKPFTIVGFVKEFNSKNKIGFRGFQYDIEPYLLENYETEKDLVLKNFVALVDQTQSFLEDTDIKFSVVIPSFFDKKDKLTPKFSYGGNADYVFGHIMNILERRDGGSIIIMSYRNFALGDDGAIAISKNEMRTARSRAYDTKVIIAQETSDVPPPYITFHRTSKDHFLDQVSKIRNAFDSYNNFGGIAVHFANSYLALE